RYEPPRKEKPKPRKAQTATVRFAGSGAVKTAFEKGFRFGTVAAEATCLARDAENLPGNIVDPEWLAERARKLDGAKVKVKVLERRDMERQRMGALLGVTRGSRRPPKLIVLEHAPAGARRTVCIVGKGLTFDTGGISIKPSAKMDEMRYDMC